ncbi:MAG TPA: hypothetical protein VJ850_06385 [Candidatus Limnocylindrales bacterium]|nr:hypothetical protein [Candidatus Limnocylindrales bacterium]
MSRHAAWIAKLVMVTVLASASLFVRIPPVRAAVSFWSADQASTKSGTLSGTTFTSTVVWRIGWTNNIVPIPTAIHVVSMKLTVVQNNAFYNTREDLAVMTFSSQFVAPNNIGTKYWQKIYADPHPHCVTNASGYCTFTKQENLPTTLNVPYGVSVAAIYGGTFGAGNIACGVNVIHRFFGNTLELDPLC